MERENYKMQFIPRVKKFTTSDVTIHPENLFDVQYEKLFATATAHLIFFQKIKHCNSNHETETDQKYKQMLELHKQIIYSHKS